jgi:hypothetical protein
MVDAKFELWEPESRSRVESKGLIPVRQLQFLPLPDACGKNGMIFLGVTILRV